MPWGQARQGRQGRRGCSRYAPPALLEQLGWTHPALLEQLELVQQEQPPRLRLARASGVTSALLMRRS